MSRAAGLVVLAGTAILLSGCNIVGFFLNPTEFETNVPPQYDIRQHKKEKIYLVVHATQGSRSDVDLPGKVSSSVADRLSKQAKIPQEQIIEEATVPAYAMTRNDYVKAEERAKEAGADLMLYIEVSEYHLFNMHNKDYFTGHLVTRSMLKDLETDETLWPQDASGRRVEATVELETGGRDVALGRLTAATAHCVVRELVLTTKAGYRCADEHQTVEDLMKDLE